MKLIIKAKTSKLYRTISVYVHTCKSTIVGSNNMKDWSTFIFQLLHHSNNIIKASVKLRNENNMNSK
jgi:hypothetical protein